MSATESGASERAREEAGRRDRSSANFARRRPEPRSWRTIWLRSAAAVVLLALLGWGAWWLRTADVFRVARIESGAYRFTAEEQLEEVLGRFLGRNIWTLRESEIAEALAGLPWVRDVRVSRRLPAVLEVDFREWRPLLEIDAADLPGAAQAAADRAQVLVDDGRILPFPGHLALAGLPVLTGAKCEPDSNGRAALEPQLAARILSLLTAVEESGLESVCPVDFVVARPEGFAIVLQGDLGRLLLGREEFLPRLQRYMEAHEHLEPGLIVDLRFRDRVTCRRPND